MRITDTLHGRTVEDVRRSVDGSVTIYCDSGHHITLEVVDGKIEARTDLVKLDTSAPVEISSTRMRLLEAFQGHRINYAYYDDDDNLVVVCEPMINSWKKSHGHREVVLKHTHGVIDELPPVSAKITLPSLGILGEQNL